MGQNAKNSTCANLVRCTHYPDLDEACGHVAEGPHERKSFGLFDHFVGAEEQSGRDGEAERFGSLEINRKPEARWLLKR